MDDRDISSLNQMAQEQIAKRSSGVNVNLEAMRLSFQRADKSFRGTMSEQQVCSFENLKFFCFSNSSD